jgi:hypothetical protein
VLVAEREIEKVNIIDHLRAFLGAMHLLNGPHEMPV